MYHLDCPYNDMIAPHVAIDNYFFVVFVYDLSVYVVPLTMSCASPEGFIYLTADHLWISAPRILKLGVSGCYHLRESLCNFSYYSS